MKKNYSVDITLTDFIYSIVVGAAFQNIKQPLPSVSNAVLLIALVIIIDDWVLYHAQSQHIKNTANQFAKILIMDVSILLSWFFATTYNASDIPLQGVVEGFVFWIIIFYIVTCFWERVFANQTRNLARFYSDFIIIALLFSYYWNRETLDLEICLGILLICWLLVRAYTWRQILKPNLSCLKLFAIAKRWVAYRNYIINPIKEHEVE